MIMVHGKYFTIAYITEVGSDNTSEWCYVSNNLFKSKCNILEVEEKLQIVSNVLHQAFLRVSFISSESIWARIQGGEIYEELICTWQLPVWSLQQLHKTFSESVSSLLQLCWNRTKIKINEVFITSKLSTLYRTEKLPIYGKIYISLMYP